MICPSGTTNGQSLASNDAQPRDRADRCKRAACSTLAAAPLGGGSPRALGCHTDATHEAHIVFVGQIVWRCSASRKGRMHG
jgi:hypothetical protein